MRVVQLLCCAESHRLVWNDRDLSFPHFVFFCYLYKIYELGFHVASVIEISGFIIVRERAENVQQAFL